MIVALAGRRVDAEGQNPVRFPSAPEAVEIVRHRIHEILISLETSLLVSSAACGADLLAVSEAGKLDIRRIVILPFDRDTFRSTSVTDRPGNWGPLYDAQMDELQAHGELVIAQAVSREKAYLENVHRIIKEALSLSKARRAMVAAVRVWDGQSRGEGDLTEEFGEYAESNGLKVHDIMTR